MIKKSLLQTFWFTQAENCQQTLYSQSIFKLSWEWNLFSSSFKIFKVSWNWVLTPVSKDNLTLFCHRVVRKTSDIFSKSTFEKSHLKLSWYWKGFKNTGPSWFILYIGHLGSKTWSPGLYIVNTKNLTLRLTF